MTELEYSNRTNNYLESFHHVLNQTLKVYHPKLSYLIEKYKKFLINTYNKIKESIVNINENKIEKFSIINDIYKFIDQYNEKYKTTINIHNIIQNEGGDESEIINKVCNYLLTLFYDYEEEDEDLENENSKNDEDIIIENNKNKNEIDINDYSDALEINNKDIDEENIEEDDLNFEVFYPKERVKATGKRTYNQAFGINNNELKKFQENIKLKNKKKKDKK